MREMREHRVLQQTQQSATSKGQPRRSGEREAAVSVNDAGVTALSDGRNAVRVCADANPGRSMIPGIRMSIQNEWNYPDIGLGSYTKPPIKVRNGCQNTVHLRLGPGNQ
jgi:hypothetical protein